MEKQNLDPTPERLQYAAFLIAHPQWEAIDFDAFQAIYSLRDAEVKKLKDDLAPHCAMIIKLRHYSDELMKLASDAGELAERYADDLKDSIKQSEELLDINKELSAMVRRFIVPPPTE